MVGTSSRSIGLHARNKYLFSNEVVSTLFRQKRETAMALMTFLFGITRTDKSIFLIWSKHLLVAWRPFSQLIVRNTCRGIAYIQLRMRFKIKTIFDRTRRALYVRHFEIEVYFSLNVWIWQCLVSANVLVWREYCEFYSNSFNFMNIK